MRLGLTSLLLGAQLFPLRLTAGLGLPGFPKEALAKCAPQKPGLETFPGEEKEDLLRSLEYLSEPSEPHTLTAGLGTRMRGHAIRTAAEWLLLNSLLGLPFMVGAQLLSPPGVTRNTGWETALGTHTGHCLLAASPPGARPWPGPHLPQPTKGEPSATRPFTAGCGHSALHQEALPAAGTGLHGRRSRMAELCSQTPLWA